MKSSTTGSESSTTICERRRRIVGGGAEEIGEAAPIWMLVRARGFVPIDPAAAQVELLRGLGLGGGATRGERGCGDDGGCGFRGIGIWERCGDSVGWERRAVGGEGDFGEWNCRAVKSMKAEVPDLVCTEGFISTQCKLGVKKNIMTEYLFKWGGNVHCVQAEGTTGFVDGMPSKTDT
uniref:Uncharacterized protein n=1 Tax=Oryza barthii TaxID=65489 RepID=A0A0D3F4M7_9ORYZ